MVSLSDDVCDVALAAARPTTNFPIGQDSRSLRAAFYALADSQYGNLPVRHLSGGLNKWFQAGLDGRLRCRRSTGVYIARCPCTAARRVGG